MPRFLAIDFGSRRIGLAVSNPEGTLASPLRAIQSTGRTADDIKALLAGADEFAVDAFVVGLPVNMDGTEGEQARQSRQFGDQLAKKSGKAVHYRDERLSSFAARQKLLDSDLTRKKKKARTDSLSAQIILQDFLEELRQRQPGPPMQHEPE